MQAHIKDAIAENVHAKRPINFTFLGGCYKLWRLDEAPETDWAELFAHIYYSRWVAPLCALYKPGVWFDFFLDDVIVSRINNLPESDVEAYRASRQQLLDWLKPHQPDNLRMTLTGVGALQPRDDSYRQLVLSPQQLAAAKFDWQAVNLPGLTGKNFSRIRVLV